MGSQAELRARERFLFSNIHGRVAVSHGKIEQLGAQFSVQ